MSIEQHIISLYNTRQRLKREMYARPTQRTFNELKQLTRKLKREVNA